MSEPPLPAWATLVRADNPGPMTLDGTNTWILRARDGVAVVDPGPLDERHLARAASYGPVVLTLLTHGHPDHAEGLPRWRELTGAPVLARDPALATGAAADAVPVVPGLGVDVVATPGHSGDSACFVVERDGERAICTGDTILGRGTTVVAHPDGRLADYLASLERLRDLGPLLVLPGHGPVLPDLSAVASAYLAHRAQRLAQVRAALAAGDVTPQQVVRRVYAEVDPVLWPAAERTVRAQLDYLAER